MPEEAEPAQAEATQINAEAPAVAGEVCSHEQADEHLDAEDDQPAIPPKPSLDLMAFDVPVGDWFTKTKILKRQGQTLRTDLKPRISLEEGVDLSNRPKNLHAALSMHSMRNLRPAQPIEQYLESMLPGPSYASHTAGVGAAAPVLDGALPVPGFAMPAPRWGATTPSLPAPGLGINGTDAHHVSPRGSVDAADLNATGASGASSHHTGGFASGSVSLNATPSARPPAVPPTPSASKPMDPASVGAAGPGLDTEAQFGGLPAGIEPGSVKSTPRTVGFNSDVSYSTAASPALLPTTDNIAAGAASPAMSEPSFGGGVLAPLSTVEESPAKGQAGGDGEGRLEVEEGTPLGDAKPKIVTSWNFEEVTDDGGVGITFEALEAGGDDTSALEALHDALQNMIEMNQDDDMAPEIPPELLPGSGPYARPKSMEENFASIVAALPDPSPAVTLATPLPPGLAAAVLASEAEVQKAEDAVQQAAVALAQESAASQQQAESAPHAPEPPAEQPAVAAPPAAEQPAVAAPPAAEQPAVAAPPAAVQPAVAAPPAAEQPAVAAPPAAKRPTTPITLPPLPPAPPPPRPVTPPAARAPAAGPSTSAGASHAASPAPPAPPAAAAVAAAAAKLASSVKAQLDLTIKVAFHQGRLKPLNIVIMVVGTRGDVQPFIGIGLKLKEYGHRVRIASHALYREFVVGFGLEFYPIGGDPKVLSEFVVKHRGIMPGWDVRDALNQREQVRQILYSTWGACVEPDPQRPDKPFVADAIVANPPSYGHTHCAEALNIPCHIVFTMPWTPTKVFPQPFARIRTVMGAANSKAREVMNWLSYFAMEDLAWLGMAGMVKDFRQRVLGLKAWNKLTTSHAIYHSKVPVTYIWSPSLVPRPGDWPNHCEVVGFINVELKKLTTYNPPKELADFLAAGPPPVYIGFGSLVVDNPERLTESFLEALRKTGLRGIIQRGWGGLGSAYGKGGRASPRDVLFIDSAPHDWLFEQVCAVVHHGGAGTTATGLYAGKPTFIVPFFGDQPFWGAAVSRVGAGPDPVPIDDLTTPRIIDALKELILPTRLRAAQEIGRRMHAEDGIANTVDHLHRTIYGALVGGRLPVWMANRAAAGGGVGPDGTVRFRSAPAASRMPTSEIQELEDEQGNALRGNMSIPARIAASVSSFFSRSAGGAPPSPHTPASALNAARSSANGAAASPSPAAPNVSAGSARAAPPVVDPGAAAPKRSFLSWLGC